MTTPQQMVFHNDDIMRGIYKMKHGLELGDVKKQLKKYCLTSDENTVIEYVKRTYDFITLRTATGARLPIRKMRRKSRPNDEAESSVHFPWGIQVEWRYRHAPNADWHTKGWGPGDTAPTVAPDDSPLWYLKVRRIENNEWMFEKIYNVHSSQNIPTRSEEFYYWQFEEKWNTKMTRAFYLMNGFKQAKRCKVSELYSLWREL